MREENQTVPAMMRIEEGETIAGMWVTPLIPNIGVYKLLAKRKIDGTCEWVHFLQRTDGTKHSAFSGTVESEEELQNVIDAVNRTLARLFDPTVQLKEGEPNFYSLDGTKLDGTTPSNAIH